MWLTVPVNWFLALSFMEILLVNMAEESQPPDYLY
jgi:hypothetical protein